MAFSHFHDYHSRLTSITSARAHVFPTETKIHLTRRLAKFCDRFSCLYNLQSHTVSELKTKFGDTDSVGRMRQLVHVYFGHLFQ